MSICKVCDEYTTGSDDKFICAKCEGKGFWLNDYELFTVTGTPIVGYHFRTPFTVDATARFPQRIVLMHPAHPLPAPDATD